MGRVYMVMVCLLHGLFALGQSVHDSTLRTYELDAVHIQQDRLRSAEVGLTRVEMDTLMLEQFEGSSLAELLRTVAGTPLRSYGSNGLTTPSFRGTGGSQTAVVWNGVNIQSPLSGQRDLSLLPAVFVDDLSIQKGGSATLYGSGAIGGTIQLNNPVHFKKGLSVGTTQELGSFGNHFQSYRAEWSGEKFENSTRFFSRKLNNDFPYTNNYVRPERKEKRENAAISQYGFYQQNHFRIGEHQLIGAKVWWQENRVEIPEIILAAGEGQAVQRDDFLNGQLAWSYDKNRLGLSLKQTVIWHDLHYTNPEGAIDSESAFTSWNQQGELELQLSDRFKWLSGATYKLELSNGDALGRPGPERNSLAFFNSIQYQSEDSQTAIALSLREEKVDGEFVPFTSSLGINHSLSHQIKLRTSFSRNYRIPTFNDLYWMGEGGIGNPDLEAEKSWSAELGTDIIISHTETTEASFSTSIFSSWVEDWILWHPIAASIWTPENVKEVWSRGIETNVSLAQQLGKVQLSLVGNYTFTRSTNEQISEDANAGTLEKQLIYTPEHQMNLFIKSTYQKYYLTSNYSFVSEQFTDGENTAIFALPEYHIVDISIGRNVVLDSFSGTVRFEINNVMDTSYENRRGYPMYGRNYTLGLKLNFNN